MLVNRITRRLSRREIVRYLTLTDSATYRVIEPLRKLVCTNAVPNGGYYNPSRLVYGTNAWLQVSVNGDFLASEVEWRIVSGPGRIVVTNGKTACVEASAASGEVVVEAAFGHDSLIQPRFVLPIVLPRIIPIKAFVVEPPKLDDEDKKGEQSPWSEIEIYQMLESANNIFSQVGISFIIDGGITPVGTTADWNLDAVVRVPTSLSRSGLAVSESARQLLAVHNTNTCDSVGMFFVGTLSPANLGAFRNESSVVIPRNADVVTIAHELGHYLGLKDCYDYWKWKLNGRVLKIDINGGGDPVNGDFFKGRLHDWGDETGRGFYERGDSGARIIQSLLMYGYDSPDAVDIPHGAVKGLRTRARFGNETEDAEVGAAFIR